MEYLPMPKSTTSSEDRCHWDFYPAETPIAVVRFFEQQLRDYQFDCENAMKPRVGYARQRIRIHYGDRSTGREFQDSDDGYVIPFHTNPPGFGLTSKRNAVRAKTIALEHIIKIESTRGNEVFYRHTKYHKPALDQRAKVTVTNPTRQFRTITLRED
jgi:hypothetical protein